MLIQKEGLLHQTYCHSFLSTISNTQLNTPQPELAEDNKSSNSTTLLRNASRLTVMNNFLQSSLDMNSNKVSNISRRSKISKISVVPLVREKFKVNKGPQWRTYSNQIFDSKNVDLRMNSPTKRSQGDRKDMKVSKMNKYQQFFGMLSFMYNKKKKKTRKVEVFVEELIRHFRATGQKQNKTSIKQISQISNYLKETLIYWNHASPPFNYDHIKFCENQLPKLFFNICFEVYCYKSHRFSKQILQSIHKDIQYYSRKLNMLNLSLLCCLDAGRLYCEYFQFEKACDSYGKAIKLAVHLEDKYHEEIGIDRLGMCQYYKGNAVSAKFYHESINRLSPYDNWKIKEYYSNPHQIQKLLQEKTRQSKNRLGFTLASSFNPSQNKENIDFNFDKTIRDDNYPAKNCKDFRVHLKDMIKIDKIRKKMPIIKTAISKIQKIGEKKYQGKEYFLPKASKFNEKEENKGQDQVLMSHRSYNRNNVTLQSLKIEKDCKIIQSMLNFFWQDYNRANNMIGQSVSEEEEQ